MEAVAKSTKRFIPQNGPVSLKKDVEQIATVKHPTRVEGERFKTTKALADMNKMNGWSK